MLGVADRVGNYKRFHTQLYRNSKVQHHAETKFGAKCLERCATKYAPWQAQTTTLKYSQKLKMTGMSTLLNKQCFSEIKKLNLLRLEVGGAPERKEDYLAEFIPRLLT